MYIHTYIHILFITGRLPWQPAGIKFTQWVSGQESAFSPLHERTMRWIEKNDWHLRNCHDVLYQHAKFWEIELRAPAAGTKIGVFLYVTLGLPARWGHSSNKYCVTVYGSIFYAVFNTFSEWIVLSDALHCSHARRRHNFREIAVKNCEKSKNRRKSLCAPLHFV